MKDPCVFCAIAAGESPASIVREDREMLAFMDLFPVHAGHLLVAPREHVQDLTDCDPGLAGRLFAQAASLGSAVMEATGSQGFNVWTANGEVAGQQVLHLHLHVLPRFRDDAFGLRFPANYPEVAARTELEAMAEKVRRLASRA